MILIYIYDTDATCRHTDPEKHSYYAHNHGSPIEFTKPHAFCIMFHVNQKTNDINPLTKLLAAAPGHRSASGTLKVVDTLVINYLNTHINFSKALLSGSPGLKLYCDWMPTNNKKCAPV